MRTALLGLSYQKALVMRPGSVTIGDLVNIQSTHSTRIFLYVEAFTSITSATACLIGTTMFVDRPRERNICWIFDIQELMNGTGFYRSVRLARVPCGLARRSGGGVDLHLRHSSLPSIHYQKS